jgi:ankyrin repeat protein
MTALALAARRGSVEGVRTLLDLGAAIDFCDHAQLTVLHHAAYGRGE